MIVTKDKNYSLINMIDIAIINDIKEPTTEEILHKAEDVAKTSYEYVEVAEVVMKYTNNKIWAKKLYQKGLDISDECEDSIWLAEESFKYIKDKELATDMLNSAYLLKTTMDEFEIIIEIAKNIKIDINLLNSWIKEYSKQCKSVENFIFLAKIDKDKRIEALHNGYENIANVDECLSILDEIHRKIRRE
jgi:hypothetical protein